MDTEQARIGEIGLQSNGFVNRGVFASPGVQATVSQDNFRHFQGIEISAVVLGTLEDQRKLGVVVVIQGSDFASLVSTLITSVGARGLRDSAQFRGHQIEEFLVGFDTRSGDDHAVRSQVFQLERLQSVSIQVIDVGFETVQRHAQAFQTVGGLKDFIRKMFTFI